MDNNPVLLTVITDGEGKQNVFVSPCVLDAVDGVTNLLRNTLSLAGLEVEGPQGPFKVPEYLDIRVYRGHENQERQEVSKEVKLIQIKVELFPEHFAGVSRERVVEDDFVTDPGPLVTLN